MNILFLFMTGIFGTAAMISTMALISRYRNVNADMLRAIGSLYTRSYENSLLPGIIIHFSAGIVFAFIYAKCVSLAPAFTPGSAIVITTFFGFAHGLMVGLFLEGLVAAHHPLERFREVTFPVVIAHIVGHVVYGFSLGILFSLNWVRFQEMVESIRPGRALGIFLGYAVVWIPLFGIPIVFLAYLLYSIITLQIRSDAQRKMSIKKRKGNLV